MAVGAVAAATTIQTVRDYFLKNPPFTELLLNSKSTAPDQSKAEEDPNQPVGHRQRVKAALKEANRAVLDRSLKEVAVRGMGCTAEVVLIDGRQVHVGHVGDSRTYHYRRGKLTQITQDQTIVSRLVQLGQLTEEEAEEHPQRSELQQAIGGRSDVYPDEHSFEIESGDWLLVCTDGLSNMLRPQAMIDVLQSAGSGKATGDWSIRLFSLAAAIMSSLPCACAKPHQALAARRRTTTRQRKPLAAWKHRAHASATPLNDSATSAKSRRSLAAQSRPQQWPVRPIATRCRGRPERSAADVKRPQIILRPGLSADQSRP
jgi:protein phosphatase